MSTLTVHSDAECIDEIASLLAAAGLLREGDDTVDGVTRAIGLLRLSPDRPTEDSDG